VRELSFNSFEFDSPFFLDKKGSKKSRPTPIGLKSIGVFFTLNLNTKKNFLQSCRKLFYLCSALRILVKEYQPS
jgi:hypothetical protein